MGARSRFQPKWLEIFSIGSTVMVTIVGWLCVVALARWTVLVSSDWGSSLPTPTQFVIDLVYEPVSFAGLLLLVPTSLAFLGASANGRRWTLLGPALLVLAPQLALLQTFLAMAALALPFASLAHVGESRPRGQSELLVESELVSRPPPLLEPSTVLSSNACTSLKIRPWVFPEPEAGPVAATFPWIFEAAPEIPDEAESNPESSVITSQLLGLKFKKLGKHEDAKKEFAAAADGFDQAGLDPATAPDAAEAAAVSRFQLAEYELLEFEKLKVSGAGAALEASLEALKAAANGVRAAYDRVARYKVREWIEAAYHRKGYVLEVFTRAILATPVPPEINRMGEEAVEAYREQLRDQSAPLRR